MPRTQYEQGRAALETLTERYAERLDRNEATTRLQLIDELLFSVLGWEREECVAEERYEGRYTDYALGVPARRFIVEAKREGIAFELPAGQSGGIVSIRTLLSDTPTAQAMRQALGYAQERGVPFVAIANGHDLVAFIASRQDGVPPLEGRALVFASLEDMRARFRTLWDNLSYEAVALHTLHKTLHDTEIASPPSKLSERLPQFPRYRVRNKLQTDLQILAELFMEDLLQSDASDEEAFLRECYSTSGALSQYALLTKEILRTRYSALMRSEGMSAENAVPREGHDALKQDVLAAALSHRPIVLLGDVGVGKTMFIRHLMRIDAADVFGDAIALYLDFVAQPALVDDLPQFVAASITEQLREKHGIDIEESAFVMGVYHGDLARFDRSVWGQLKEIDSQSYEREKIRFLADKVSDREGHLKRSLEHVAKGRRKQVIIFLDNMDQRQTEFQEQVYVIAHAMAESWPATVFVSLRPSTFFTSKRVGSLSAYQPRVFTISPPRIDVVLRKRINYVLRQLNEEGEFRSLPYVGLKAENLTDYLQALLWSFEHNESLTELVDNLSGGNVRRALNFVQTFLASGNVDTEKMLERIRNSGGFTIQVHQFLRAIILGDHRDFVPAASPINNMFDLLSPDGREHFLLGLTLAEIARLGEQPGAEGFIESRVIFDYGQRMGFTPVQMSWALERAVDSEMLELRIPAGGGTHGLYRITSIGAYTVLRLPRMFAYLDAVVTDTPILDPVLRERIHDAAHIGDRLARAEMFRSYLDRQWNGLGANEPAFDWREMSDAARNDIWALGRSLAGWP